jgi:hypothetical protein
MLTVFQLFLCFSVLAVFKSSKNCLVR